MYIIIKEMSLYWIIGLLLLWSGVITAGNVTAAPGVATTSNEISAFIISIKITNRIYNDSLEDHQSQSYKILRQDVENVFLEMYSFTPSAQYQEIAEMTFSNGSVIANSTVLFGTKQKSGQTVQNIFVTNYKQHPSPKLDLHINYTADQEPILIPLSVLKDIPLSISSVTESITSPNSDTTTELSNLIQAGSTTTSTNSASTSGTDKSLDNNIATTANPQTHSATNAGDLTQPTFHATSYITSNNDNTTVHASIVTSTMSASSPSTMTVHPNSNISTMSASSSLPTVHPSSNISAMSASSSLPTVHPSSNISATSASSSSTTTVHPSSNISATSASSSSTTTVHPSSNISVTSASSSSTTTVHPSSNISVTSASSSSTTMVHPSSNISAMSASSPGKTVTQKPTGPEVSDTVATEQGVPGWGIAILVLAAIILFFMLVLLILLLLFWCCWWRQRGFMSVSDPDPTGYYNPDIPMYSTHSTYDAHNGKSLDSESQRPPKNRTGMYAVSKGTPRT